MNEEHRPIKGYENYTVSRSGVVTSYARGKTRAMKARADRNGYCRANLSLGRRDAKKTFFVHRLVAKAFILNPKSYKVVNHIDNDKSNNHASNLEWCTQAHNVAHAVKIGAHAKGERIGLAKLTEDDVREIRRRIAKGETYTELATAYKVHHGTVHAVGVGRTWKHVV